MLIVSAGPHPQPLSHEYTGEGRKTAEMHSPVSAVRGFIFPRPPRQRGRGGVYLMSQEITVADLAKRIENGHPVRLIDVRQTWEHQLARLEGSLHIPLNDLPHRTAEIPTDASALVVIYCHHGVRSLS